MKSGKMTKKEALEAMKQGHKVTREFFSGDEYIYLDSDTGHIMSEDGYDFNEWWIKIEPTIGTVSSTPWDIFN